MYLKKKILLPCSNYFNTSKNSFSFEDNGKFVLLSQFCLKMSVPNIHGVKELRCESITLPPILKVDLEATIKTGIESLAMFDSIRNRTEFSFH